jgi:hypothetical protein
MQYFEQTEDIIMESNFKEFFNKELITEEKEEEFDPKEIELGIEEEKEHKDIYDLLKAWADENKLEMPITEEEYYLMIVKAHLRENPAYYTDFLNCSEEEIPKEIEEAVKPEAIAMIKSWMSKGKKKPKKTVKESIIKENITYDEGRISSIVDCFVRFLIGDAKIAKLNLAEYRDSSVSGLIPLTKIQSTRSENNKYSDLWGDLYDGFKKVIKTYLI